ncbi:hypothetical protein PGT21_028585 [Puccinia graminis f. sp. tritici]|uniref:Uncharacterized protein n=1 Tax=Puccinia graminis f. sp. tritici TaxID=56615 RepID=A0A5B0P9B1_PUCGR|nr:hypothetical protein PGTUg99_009394 [Puccinia graminis f. sp. tritici]KAA1104632.1 hypothetical protein PGT21_028585 [Puccinia graminis f. sp. tritici]
MKNPSRCIFWALVFTRCKGTLDPFPFDWTIGTGDVLLPNPGVENQRQSWDALGSFSGNPDYLSSSPLAISRLEPLNTAGGVPAAMTDRRVSNPHLENTYETRERPTTHANGPLADPQYNNDISIQQFPVGLAPPSTHMMRSPISISSFPENLHFTYASQEPSKTSTGGDLTTRGQVNDQAALPKDPYEAQEPAIPFTPMFSWRGLSIPDIPIEVYEKRFINELRSKRARDLVVHSTSGLLPGNKRQATFEGYFKGKHAMYRQDITSDRFNAPSEFSKDYSDDRLLQIHQKAKTVRNDDMSKKSKAFNLVFNRGTFGGNRRQRYSAFAEAVKHLMISPTNSQEKVLLIETGKDRDFITQFSKEWAKITGKPRPSVLVAVGLTKFYQNSNAWRKVYQDILKMDDEQLWNRIEKLRAGLSDRIYHHPFVNQKWIESLLCFFFFVDMITTIFPKPGNVDVTVDKHQLFESAFKIFELHAPQIPNAARTKYPSFIWECVDHWLCAREDYVETSLIDSKRQPITMGYHFKMFFGLVFSHSVTTLSENAAGKKVLME